MTAAVQLWARFVLARIPSAATETVFVSVPPAPDPTPGADPGVAHPRRVLDTETLAAMDAARAEVLPILIDPAGLALAEFVPFRLEHEGPIVGPVLSVRRDGDTFSVTAEAEATWYAALNARHAVSPGITVHEARIVTGAGFRYVDVTRSELYEVVATNAPHLPDTTLFVGNPGVAWLTPETFASDPGSDRMVIAFPTHFRAGSDVP